MSDDSSFRLSQYNKERKYLIKTYGSEWRFIIDHPRYAIKRGAFRLCLTCIHIVLIPIWIIIVSGVVISYVFNLLNRAIDGLCGVLFDIINRSENLLGANMIRYKLQKELRDIIKEEMPNED